MNRPIAIDLFSGCGGLTLGLKQAGFDVIGAIDNDPSAVDSYLLNHPEVPVWKDDIKAISGDGAIDRFGVQPGEVDLLAGCPPCQGFSTLRTMNGACDIEDDRNDLVFEFLRFVEVFLPKAIMMENVPGLAKDARFERFRARLESLGYKTQHAVLNAADYSVPQRRRRLILVAGRLGGSPSLAEPCEERKTVRQAIDSLPDAGTSGDPLHDIPERRSPRVKAMIERIPKNGGGRLDLDASFRLSCHEDCDGFKDVYGRMAWDRPGPTITGGCFNPSKGRFLHPEENRAITLREAALLQSFPSDYRISLKRGKVHAALLIGNALPPAFIKRHAESLHEYLIHHHTEV